MGQRQFLIKNNIQKPSQGIGKGSDLANDSKIIPGSDDDNSADIAKHQMIVAKKLIDRRHDRTIAAAERNALHRQFYPPLFGQWLKSYYYRHILSMPPLCFSATTGAGSLHCIYDDQVPIFKNTIKEPIAHIFPK